MESLARFFYYCFILGFIFLLLPIILVVSIFIVLESGMPILFEQRRVGMLGKTFTLYKFRTMRVGAVGNQQKYRGLNEADGPVFKIRNDPRYTRVGKFLSHCALDELPQLINIIKGEMAFVGPRP